jgi:uncharacterized protein YeaO (DUF488 family)
MRTISIKRAYEDAAPDDGFRVLVDRLWPRGRTKAQVALSQWSKVLAPSAPLREWFDHRADRFVEFTRRYESELAANPAVQEALDSLPSSHVTLIYGARDPRVNHAMVLADYLRRHGK